MCKIITHAELQYRSLPELQALYRNTQTALTHSAPGSAQRRNALASLETLARAIAYKRSLAGPRP